MSRVSTIIQQRRLRRLKERQSPAAWRGLTCFVVLGLFVSVALVSSSIIYTYLADQLPSLDLLPLYLDSPQGLLLQPTRLLDRTGTHVLLTLSNPASSGSQYLTAKQIPEVVIHAILASTDPTFWQNSGFDWDGVIQGAHPTLAQRLVDEFLLQDEPSGLVKSFRERLLAAQITQKYGREKILEWYLNSLEFGPLVYGVDAAANVYFGVPASDLSLAQATALAALAETPEINPNVAPQTIEDNRNVILQKMLIQGWLTAEDILQANQEKLTFLPQIEQNNLSLAFTNLVFNQLEKQIPYRRFARGGFQITTTLDYDLQMQTVCSSESLVARLQAQPPVPTTPDGSPCQASRLISSPDNPTEAPFSAQASVIVLDPQSGQILSMVSEPGLSSQYASVLEHDPGSLLSPFLYLTAFTRGFSPGSMLWDLPPQTGVDLNTSIVPNINYHGPLRLRTALANNYPGPATQIANQVGSENVLRTIQEFGFGSDKKISLLEAVRAYGILANQGIESGQTIEISTNTGNHSDLLPISILRVDDNQGRVWLDWSNPQTQSVLSPQLAYLVNNVLSDESARWASLGHPNPLEVGRPAAGLISRVTSQKEEWTLGYTPQRVVGVWLGSDKENTNPLPQNSSALLWHAILQYVTRNLSPQAWSIPSGIKAIKVCDPSGLLPTEICPVIVSEVFLEDNLPTQPDNLYRKFQVNRETGKLATVFTPPELVEDRVYLSLPPEAVIWAQENHMPVPPDTYDPIFLPSETSSSVQITSPAIFEGVGGIVSLIGTASGEDFQFYRLQVGKGLNPQEWIQIGQDSKQSLINNVLGVWDTRGLSGLYAIQLLVVRANQHVDRYLTQVTVDNQAPIITLVSPKSGQVFSLAKDPTLLFQVEANDDLEIKQVQFYLDGAQIASLTQKPYTLPWKTPPASNHELQVEALDLAGNKSSAVVNFTVK